MKRIRSFALSRLFPALLALLALGLSGPSGRAEDKPAPAKLPAVFDKAAPETVEDLKAFESHVEKVLARAIPATVGVRIGPAQGSGVIVSKDGYVLTAGHVSGTPGREVTLILHDGKTVKAKTLGVNSGIDSGMLKITEEGEWPFAELGESEGLKTGQWCIACGHPGGYKTGRAPVVRVGRVMSNGNRLVVSDCCIVGGDSGGPLFDMHGKVIGIHSKINQALTTNMHVPADTYRYTWDRLAKGESWRGGAGNDPWLGTEGDTKAKDCLIAKVLADSPAEKGGLKANDIVKTFAGEAVAKYQDLATLVRKKKPGDEVALEVLRGEETITLKLIVGKN